MNKTVTTVEELLTKVTAMNMVEDELTKSIADADGNYSEGKLTLDEWEEVSEPLFASRSELRFEKLKIEDELLEMTPDVFVDEVTAWELRNAVG
jgi:hypothetical protein